MKILVDENIPLITVKSLREKGHDVLDIRGTSNEGMINSLLWEKSQKEERLLITTDKGFAQYRDIQHHGVLIICLQQPNRYKIHERVVQAIDKYTTKDWNNLLVIMYDEVQSTFHA